MYLKLTSYLAGKTSYLHYKSVLVIAG